MEMLRYQDCLTVEITLQAGYSIVANKIASWDFFNFRKGIMEMLCVVASFVGEETIHLHKMTTGNREVVNKG